MFDIDFLGVLRVREFELVLKNLKSGVRILEFGAGTGTQALELQKRGFDVIAVDLVSSGYSADRVFPILDYDGRHLPIPNQSVDLIFSSNVLEHVEEIDQILSEFRRVLSVDGYCVHLMPSVAWRVWTFATGIPTSAFAMWLMLRQLIRPSKMLRILAFKKYAKVAVGSLLPIGHGTSVEGLSELWTFSVYAWRSKFRRAGFVVEAVYPLGIFHTGHMLAGRQLSTEKRERLANHIGSAANVFVVRPYPPQSKPDTVPKVF